MHIHAKLPTIVPPMASPQPQRSRATTTANGPEDADRVTRAKDRDGSGHPRHDKASQRQNSDRSADPEPRRDPAASLAAALVALSLGGQD